MLSTSTVETLRLFNPSHTYTCADLHKFIELELTSLGFSNARQVLINLPNKLLHKDELSSLQPREINNIKLNVLKLIACNLTHLREDEDFKYIVKIMSTKAKKFACESVLKLALFCQKNAAIKKISQDINTNINFMHIKMPPVGVTQSDLENVFGYLLALNLNKCSYMKIAFYSLQNPFRFHFSENIISYQSLYVQFITANHLATSDPSQSKLRRDFLYKSGLLESHLQRDPEEVERYDAQMLSAQTDKDKLLCDIQSNQHNNGIIIIDIGPAGGATYKSVISMAYNFMDIKKIGYYGIEYDDNELLNLNELMNSYTYNSRSHKNLLTFSHFIQGNALELSNVINTIDSIKSTASNQFISIILSSVIHEIYSYCPYAVPIKYSKDVNTLTSTIKNQYNPETIYKIYYEGLKTIAEHPGGGSLNIRDGVMYKNPEEIVTFTLNNELWVKLFIEFINDIKYTHLKQKIAADDVRIGNIIKLEAKYVQEFMLKANWGPESFGNEINEVYCYLTLKDHIKLLQSAAEALSIKITIPNKVEYTQEGYLKHIDQSKISIFSGFNENNHFPPTNMVLKVELADKCPATQKNL